MKKNIFTNHSLEEYNKKYRNLRKNLITISKEQVDKVDKEFNDSNFNNNYLLKGRSWWLINNTYYEIPRAPRLTWFRNLKTSTQVITSALLAGGVSCAIVFPTLCATIWKPITLDFNTEISKYVDIKIEGGTIEKGKSLTAEIVLKEEEREDKQLPKKLNVVKTGDVVLQEGQYEEEATRSLNNSSNVKERDNYYTYTYTRDKGVLFIKEVVGPVSIEMGTTEDRTWDVTFDPNNECDKVTVAEAKKNTKLDPASIRVIEETPYRKCTGWYLGDSKTSFDFDTPITGNITLTARYTGESKQSGVYVKGLKGITQENRYFDKDHLADAYEKGNTIIKNLPKSIDETTFKNTFDDYVVVESGGKTRYLANLSWYVFGEVTFQSFSNFYFSFGKTDKNLGVNFDFYNTNLIGVTDNAKIDTWQRFAAMGGNYKDSIDNPFNIKNIELNMNWPEAGSDFITFYGGGGANSHFVLNIDHCKFDSPLISYGSHKKTIKITNSTFAINRDFDYCFETHRDDYYEEGKVKEDTLIFKNNIVDGSHTRKCMQLNDEFCKYGDIEGNTFKNVHTDTSIEGSKPGDSVIQFSQGLEYNVSNNIFEKCECNVFMVHEDLPTLSSGVKLNISNNTLTDCGYVGVNETGDSTQYKLVSSSGNKILGTTKDDCCYNGTTLCKKGTDNEKYIFYINK